jgi:hypothetical protein
VRQTTEESATNLAASSNPFDDLPTRQLLVIIGYQHNRSLDDMAKLFGLTRLTTHRDLKAAMRTLAARPRTAPVTLPADVIETVPPYDCPTHGNECPETCSYLAVWMSEFERAYRRS